MNPFPRWTSRTWLMTSFGVICICTFASYLLIRNSPGHGEAVPKLQLPPSYLLIRNSPDHGEAVTKLQLPPSYLLIRNSPGHGEAVPKLQLPPPGV